MKRILSLIIILSMIFSVVVSLNVFADEIIFSESFENGISTWKKATGKTSEENTKVVSEKTTDGKVSLYVKDADESTAFGYKTDKITAKEGCIYKLSCDLYHVEGTGAKPFMTFYDSYGEKLEGKSETTKKIGEWDNVVLEMEAPAGTTSLIISIMGSSKTTGESYIDNIKLTKSESFSPSKEETPVTNYKDGDLVYSENFEAYAKEWKYSNALSKEVIKIVDNIYSEGSKSIRISDDITDKAIGIVSPYIPVEGGCQYTVAADMYILYGTAVKIYVQMFDDNGTRVFSKAFNSKGRKWNVITLVCDVPQNAVKCRISISGISTSQGDALVDNIRMYKGKIDVKSDFSNSVGDSEGEREFTFQDMYEMPSFKPEKGMHPRLYFNKNDIERIKMNATHPQNKSAYSQFLKEVNSSQDGTIVSKTGNNLNSETMSIIQSKAFYYAVWGDESKGKEAISSLHNFINDTNVYDSEYNAQGFLVFTIAAVYDWCYSLLTEEDKKVFQNMGLVAASTMEVGFPPAGGSVLNAHAAEAMLQRDQMAFAIAVSDEREDIYKNVAGRYFEELIESKKFLAKSHSSLFGNSYADYRYQWEVLSVFMMRALGFENIFGDEHGKVLYWNMYARRPDGSSLHDGDSISNNQSVGPYDERGTRAYFLAGNCYKDPYLKGEALRRNNGIIISNVSSNQTLSAIEVLCFNDPSIGYSSAKELPLSKYFPSPRGEYIARTGWEDGIDSPVVVAQMNIGEYWTQGHDHLDSGEFEIYYKGALANDTGYYQAGKDGSTAENSGNTVSGTVHFYNYQRRTIAHNCMLVFDPNEDLTNYNGYANDGGQIYASGESSVSSVYKLLEKEDTNKVGTVLGREMGEDLTKPDYTYIKGDLQNGYGEKVPEYERSFMFLNLKNNDYPAAMVVFDRVVSKDKSFEKSWVLHGLNKPDVNGKRTVFADTRPGYNGKLTIDTLLPKEDNLEIRVVGGENQEYMVNGTNYWAQPLANKMNEGGGYRIEVSPKEESEEDYFLNVLQVGDTNKNLISLNPEMIESATHLGAKIYDRVVMFGKGKDRISSSVNFDVAGDGWFKYTIADLKEGTWQVIKNGSNLCEIVASKDGGVGSFEGGAGSYTLKYLGEYGEKVFTETSQPYTEGINLKLEPENKFIYSDVDPFTVNGRTLVPLRAIFEALKANVTWNEETKTATGEKDGKVIKIIENSEIAYVNGNEYKLDAPAMIKDGRFVVPVRFIAESFGVKVDWDDFSKTVIIKTNSASDIGTTYSGYFKPMHKIENALPLYALVQSGDDGAGNNIENIVDGSFTTGWGAKEDVDGNKCFGIFDLGEVKKVESVNIAYRMGDSRKYTFSIYISEDGKNYTLALDKAVTSGTSLDFEKFDLKGIKGRYIKYIGFGNTTNNWSNMAEIVFTGK